MQVDTTLCHTFGELFDEARQFDSAQDWVVGRAVKLGIPQTDEYTNQPALHQLFQEVRDCGFVSVSEFFDYTQKGRF